MELRREMILIRIRDAERLSRRPRNEAHLGGQDGGQRGGDGALAAPVDPQNANVEGHASAPLPARNLYSGPGTKAREPATSRVNRPWKVIGSSSRKNSAAFRSSSRISTRWWPSIRIFSAPRCRRRGARTSRSVDNLPLYGIR